MITFITIGDGKSNARRNKPKPTLKRKAASSDSDSDSSEDDDSDSDDEYLNKSKFGLHVISLSHSYLTILYSLDIVYCGSSNPIWTCKNGMNKPLHKCRFALCSHCYIKRQGLRQVKRNRSMVVKNRNDCDHNNLEVFGESECFKPEYVKTRHERGDIFPTECFECKRSFWHRPIKRTV